MSFRPNLDFTLASPIIKTNLGASAAPGTEFRNWPLPQGSDDSGVFVSVDYQESSNLNSAEEERSINIALGSGAVDVVSAALKLIKSGKDVYNAYGSETATKLKNMYGKYINKNPNWRPGYAGEKHLIDPYIFNDNIKKQQLTTSGF